MYNQDKFIEILKKCQGEYSLNEYARKSNVDVGYIWRMLNKKKNNPPSPAILKKIASSSRGITTYNELMQVCGYTDYIIDDFFEDNIQNDGNRIPVIDTITYNENTKTYTTIPTQKYVYTNIKIDPDKEYISVIGQDDSMIPLIGRNDIVIIERTSQINNGRVHLLYFNNKIILRRVIKIENNNFELEPLNMRYPKEITKDIHSIGEVISVEIQSAFL